MKFAKTAVILLLSLSFVAVGIFTIAKTMDKKPQNDVSVSDSTDSVADANSDVIADDSEPVVADSQSEPADVQKIVFDDISAKDISLLDGTAVTWGPGVNFNESNQPVACVNLQEKYGDTGAVFINSDDRIYLTFDLGYESGFTNDILDVLKETNTKAVFFLTGSYAEKQTEIVQRIVSEGHTVGNHSFSHPDMTALSDAEAVHEITKVHDIIKDNYGYESYLFRFPSGVFSEKTVALAAENGYRSIFWSFAYNDWDNANQPDHTEALTKLCDRLHPGAVYLLHPMETNSRILKDFITTAKAKGYEIGIM